MINYPPTNQSILQRIEFQAQGRIEKKIRAVQCTRLEIFGTRTCTINSILIFGHVGNHSTTAHAHCPFLVFSRKPLQTLKCEFFFWEGGGVCVHFLPNQSLYNHMLPNKSLYNHLLPNQSLYNLLLPNQFLYNHLLPNQSLYNHLLPNQSLYNHLLPNQSLYNHLYFPILQSL